MKQYIIKSAMFAKPVILQNAIAFNTLVQQLQLNSIEYDFEIKDVKPEVEQVKKPFGKRAPKYKSGVIGRQNS